MQFSKAQLLFLAKISDGLNRRNLQFEGKESEVSRVFNLKNTTTADSNSLGSFTAENERSLKTLNTTRSHWNFRTNYAESLVFLGELGFLVPVQAAQTRPLGRPRKRAHCQRHRAQSSSRESL